MITQTGQGAWRVSAGELVLDTTRDGIEMLDGHSEESCELGSLRHESKEADRLSVTQTFADATLRHTIETREPSSAPSIFWTVEVTNTGPEQLWREVRLGLSFPEPASWRYWDGYADRGRIETTPILATNANPVGEERDLPDKHFPLSEEMREKLLKEAGGNRQAFSNFMFSGPWQRYVFPAACVYDDLRCLCLGISPDQLLSYHSSGVDRRFYASTKLVIDPGETESVAFVAYATPGTYGWREAVGGFYERFPDHFRSRSGIDPRLMGVAETSTYSLNYETSELVAEDRRRFGTTWTWSMHAYEKVGLFYPRRDDYDPYGAWVEASVRGAGYEEFVRYVRESYRRADGVAAPVYYILPQMLDKAYAEEHFPDAVWRTSDGRTITNNFGAESVNKKVEGVGILAAGSAYADRVLEDLRDVAESIRPRGIGFDNVEGPRMDFAPHAQRCPGRAFADGQVYVTQAIAYAMLMQFVRELPSHGGKMAVAGNGPGTYHSTCRMDVAIVETGPWTDPVGAMALRCLMGSKPIVYWGPKEFAGSAQVDGQALKDKLDELNHWLFLFSLRSGIIPNAAHNLKGYRKMQERLPLLMKIIRKGWQPVPGAVCSAPEVSVERFGREFINVVNETEAPVTAVLDVDLGYFLQGTESFAACYGSAGTQKREGQTVTIEVHVPARDAVVLRSDAAVDPAPAVAVTGDTQQILEFPFLEGRRAASQILLDDNHTAQEYDLARRVMSYFRYYALMREHGEENPDFNYQVYLFYDLIDLPAPRIPIRRWSERHTEVPAVRLHLGHGPDIPAELRGALPAGCVGAVGVFGRDLHVMGSDMAALGQALETLLKLLDEKYVMTGKRWFVMRREQQGQEALLMAALGSDNKEKSKT